MVYLVWSLKYGRRAEQNPWGAKGLEWERSSSPPPTFNFGASPVVTEEAYAYPDTTVPAPAHGEGRGV
jgi:cytochrome c oxidase subunit 1